MGPRYIFSRPVSGTSILEYRLLEFRIWIEAFGPIRSAAVALFSAAIIRIVFVLIVVETPTATIPAYIHHVNVPGKSFKILGDAKINN